MRIVCADSFLIHIRVKVGGGEASFRSLARSYCPLATLPLFGEEPRHYFGVVWTNNCLVCRYVLRADSRIVVFTVLGFRARRRSRPVSIPSPKRWGNLVNAFFWYFRNHSFLFLSFFFWLLSEIETSKVFMRYLISVFFLVFIFGLIFETRD